VDTVFGVSADTGAMRPLQSVAPANPAHLVLDAAQSHLYAINEFDDYGGQGNAGSIEACALDPASGGPLTHCAHPGAPY
jgi:6-phosphogluconolactonase (cycloisomerase 2 family)